MTTAASGNVIAVVVAGAVTSFLIILFVVIASVVRAAKAAGEQARAKYPDARLVENALFFGQESRGAAQMRGNGTLVLTDSELVFEQWVVNRTFRVPYSAIVAIETPRAFLGKSQGVKLLKVAYRDEAGNPDALAWRVRDLDRAIAAIQSARGQ